MSRAGMHTLLVKNVDIRQTRLRSFSTNPRSPQRVASRPLFRRQRLCVGMQQKQSDDGQSAGLCRRLTESSTPCYCLFCDVMVVVMLVVMLVVGGATGMGFLR